MANRNIFFQFFLMVFIMVIFLLPYSAMCASSATEKVDPNGWQEWGEKYWPSKPVPGGILRAASPVYIGLMNPNHFPVMDWVTISRFYERLIYVDRNYKPTVPFLAESWKYIDDLTVVMKLRKNVKFHDGSSFNAQSLKYQMDWILDKNNHAWTKSWLKPLKSVEVIDEYTVKWKFKKPWGAFLGTLASVPGYMISSEALKKDAAISQKKTISLKIKSLERKIKRIEKKLEEKPEKKGELSVKLELLSNGLKNLKDRKKEIDTLTENAVSLDQHPVGTGPFMFEKASPGNYVKLKRNPNWWLGKAFNVPDMPYFDGMKVSVIPDPSVRLANLRAGKLDLVTLTAAQYKIVEKDKRINKGVLPLNWLIFLSFNHKKGPCKDIRVRKAISHAIDRKALVMGTQFGLGRQASCVYPDDHWAHNPNLKPVEFNPELSKKLLAEAGYPNGLTLKGFTLNIPEAQAFAKATMAMLKKVGIKWDVTFLGITGMAEPFRRLNYDIVGNLYQWILEPDHVATILYHPDSPFNNGRSSNPKAIKLIEAGRQEMDDKKRTQIYHELEKVLYENYEDAWLWYPSAVLAYSKKIEGTNFKMMKKHGEVYNFSHPNWFKNGKP